MNRRRTDRGLGLNRRFTDSYPQQNPRNGPLAFIRAQHDPYVPAFSGDLDWFPRRGQDLDAGMRIHREPLIPYQVPSPHPIGALNGFLPLFNIWALSSQSSDTPMGPFIGSESAPGTRGYYDQYYESLRKVY